MNKKGALFNKLKYKQYANKKSKSSDQQKTAMECVDVSAVTTEIDKLSLEDELAYLSFFKTCFVERDKEILKIKLQQSISLREKVIRKREIKFVESFPFYFVAPDLVTTIIS